MSKWTNIPISFHGRLLIKGAEISLNYGQRYGLLGANGSGKVRIYFALRPVDVILIMFQSTSIAERDIEIPSHIDIYTVRGEAEPSEVNAVDFVVASAKVKVACLEAYIEELSVADSVEELEEMDHPPLKPKLVVSFTVLVYANDDKQTHQGYVWRMAHARRPHPDPLRQTPSPSPRRTHQLLGSRSRCVARSLSIHV